MTMVHKTEQLRLHIHFLTVFLVHDSVSNILLKFSFNDGSGAFSIRLSQLSVASHLFDHLVHSFAVSHILGFSFRLRWFSVISIPCSISFLNDSYTNVLTLLSYFALFCFKGEHAAIVKFSSAPFGRDISSYFEPQSDIVLDLNIYHFYLILTNFFPGLINTLLSTIC